ncbi:MAG TPA: hypothetical protein VGK21_15785, partial [Candidatus Angelobacter sp.]
VCCARLSLFVQSPVHTSAGANSFTSLAQLIFALDSRRVAPAECRGFFGQAPSGCREPSPDDGDVHG